jgi:histidinol dehydrogenase
MKKTAKKTKTDSILRLADVELSAADEKRVAQASSNIEVLAKNITKVDKDELLKMLAYETRTRRRMQLVQRIIARIGVLIRGEMEAEAMEEMQR